MISLTAAQAEALAFIENRIEADGVAPSCEEIKQHVGLASKSGVHRLLTALEERGRIRRMKNRARAIEVIPAQAPNALSTFSSAQLVAELARRGSELRRAA